MPLVRRASSLAVRRDAPALARRRSSGSRRSSSARGRGRGSSRSSAAIRRAPCRGSPGSCASVLEPEAGASSTSRDASRLRHAGSRRSPRRRPVVAGGRGPPLGASRRRASSPRICSSSPSARRSCSSRRCRRDPASEGWRIPYARPRRLLASRDRDLARAALADRRPRELLATRLLRASSTTRVRAGARRAGRGQSALPRGARCARSSRRAGWSTRHRTWTTTLKPSLAPAAGAREPPRRPDRPARRRARAGWRRSPPCSGASSPSSILEHVAGERREDELAALFRAEIVRELRRYPELRVRVPARAAPGGGAVVARRRRRVASSTARWPPPSRSSTQGALDDHFERLAHYHAQSGRSHDGAGLPRPCGRAGRRARRRLARRRPAGARGWLARGQRLGVVAARHVSPLLLAGGREVDAVERVVEEAAEALGDERRWYSS